MSDRTKSLLISFGVPLLLFAFALGAAEYKLNQKEDAATHAADIQRLEARQAESYSLLLDMRCESKPSDRRCK